MIKKSCLIILSIVVLITTTLIPLTVEASSITSVSIVLSNNLKVGQNYSISVKVSPSNVEYEIEKWTVPTKLGYIKNNRLYVTGQGVYTIKVTVKNLSTNSTKDGVLTVSSTSGVPTTAWTQTTTKKTTTTKRVTTTQKPTTTKKVTTTKNDTTSTNTTTRQANTSVKNTTKETTSFGTTVVLPDLSSVSSSQVIDNSDENNESNNTQENDKKQIGINTSYEISVKEIENKKYKVTCNRVDGVDGYIIYISKDTSEPQMIFVGPSNEYTMNNLKKGNYSLYFLTYNFKNGEYIYKEMSNSINFEV